MIKLFHETAFKCSKLITRQYSTSFTLGIQTLAKSLHFPIYAIYGYVRYADEIVDTFHGFDKEELLQRYRQDTYTAIEEGISLNPVLHAFQRIVRQYQIDMALIDAFLDSMKMDLHYEKYNTKNYDTYIYGSAEVVGLMCLKVFCKGDAQAYQKLKPAAQKLGSAFQKVNFLRDMQSDYDERGRVYFPNLKSYEAFDEQSKAEIIADIEADFVAAYRGIVQLPEEARCGVYLAYIYYLKLFYKIKRASTQNILHNRIRIPNVQKAWLLGQTYLKYRLNYL